MSVYTTEARIEAYLARDLTAAELVILDSVIEYLSSFINSYTNRDWREVDADEYTEPEASERLFDGSGNKQVYIDDFYDLTELEILDSAGNVALTLTEDDEFIQYPLNKTIKESVYLRNYKFPDGPANISITAIFSSGEVPADVVIVATALVSKFLSRSSTTTGFKRESIEGYSYELMTGIDVEEETKVLLLTLDKYKKVLL